MDDVPAPREFLNSLSLEDASAYMGFIHARGDIQARFNTPIPYDLQCYQSIDVSIPNGSWWADHVTCLCLKQGAGSQGLDWSSGYPRHQLKFGAKRKAGETTKTPIGKSHGAQLKRVLSDEAWAKVKEIASANKSGRFTFQVHHLAYCLRRLKAQNDVAFPELPVDLGAGMAISHLCDNHSCCKESHMQLKAQAINMSMQRCVGATLIVKDGVILQVHHCSHYVEQPDGTVVQPDCAKLSVVVAGSVFQIAPEFQAAFNAASQLYLQKKQELDAEEAVEAVLEDEEDDWFE